MGAKAILAGAAAVWLMGAAAGAQEAPSFPRSLEREPLLTWLQRETDITPERVVAVTPQAITALVSTFPAGGGQGPRLVIRAEALNGETYARTGALSWHVSLNADCPGHRVRLGDTTGYPERNLLGERRILRPAEADWRTPETGTALDNAWRAACDGQFKGPFYASSVKVVQADAAAPPPAPPPIEPAAVVAPAPAPQAPPPAIRPRIAPAAPAKAAASGGAASVQIGAFPDEASANAALAKWAPGQSHHVESAVVNGRPWRRAVVSGFPDREAAGRYCAALKARGGTCFVRPRS